MTFQDDTAALPRGERHEDMNGSYYTDQVLSVHKQAVVVQDWFWRISPLRTFDAMKVHDATWL